MLEGAGRHLAHPSEHFLVHIRELDQRDVGGEAESLFDEIEQRVGAEEEDAVDQQVVVIGKTFSIFAVPFWKDGLSAGSSIG